MPQQSRLGLVLLAGLLVVVFYLTKDGSPDKPAPALSLASEFGGRIDPLASYHGRPVLLVFWTTSCGICQHELPLLNRLAPEFRSRGIAVVAIHLGGEAAALEFMQSQGLNLATYADTDGAAARAYNVNGVPKLVLITQDGKIKRSASGWMDERELRQWMDSAS
jgi:peroxiredoxin